MRSAIVPAQITTVEDKVMGVLSLSQLLLLSSPIFIGSLIYFVFPPSLGDALYKTILTGIVTAILWALAVRIKGRIALLWVITIGRYSLRPRYFVNDKNDLFLRECEPMGGLDPADDIAVDDNLEASAPVLSFSDIVFLERIVTDPKANLHFIADRKGELRVHVNEER